MSRSNLYQIERDVLNPPAEYGYPFSNWALGNLVDHIMESYSISVSKSTICRILKGLDFRFNRPRHSPKKGLDPLLKAKMKEILEVLCSPVAGNHVLYEDEVENLYPTGKIHIILDNCGIHKAKKVQEWLAKHLRVRLHFLPAYMPELNPVKKI